MLVQKGRIQLMIKVSEAYDRSRHRGEDFDFSQTGLTAEEVEEFKSINEPFDSYLESVDTNPAEWRRHLQWMRDRSSSEEEYQEVTLRTLTDSIMRKVRRAESQKAKKQTS